MLAWGGVPLQIDATALMPLLTSMYAQPTHAAQRCKLGTARLNQILE